jgi:hypothetical protein
MFEKKRVLSHVREVVTDGILLYRGELRDDIFYRLRLETEGQMKLVEEKVDLLMEPVKTYDTVEFELQYTLNGITEIDVYAVGNELKRPYVAIDKKYRKLFTMLELATYKIKYIPQMELTTGVLLSSIYIQSQYGEIIIMPINLDRERIFR